MATRVDHRHLDHGVHVHWWHASGHLDRCGTVCHLFPGIVRGVVCRRRADRGRRRGSHPTGRATGKNQVRSNENLYKQGVIEYLGKADSVSNEHISKTLLKFINGYDCTNMSKLALEITDGNGVELVSQEFLN